TTKVPLPCMGTAVQSGGVPLASFTRSARISFTILMKATSRDPRSCNIACFTVRLVVSGPGVKSSLAVDMGGHHTQKSAVRLQLLLALCLCHPAFADEMHPIGSLSSWTFTWGGYVHAAYRWIDQPQNYNLTGKNNGFQLESARLGANVEYKNQL